MADAPTFRLLPDGEHVEWKHDCVVHDYVEGVLTEIPKRTTTELPHGGGAWQVQQREPLTVTPSIHCHACGTHGWITAGQWVPA